MARHGLEQVDAVLGPLGRKAAPQPPAGILTRSVEGRHPPHPSARQRAVPLGFVEVEPLGRKGAIRRTAAVASFLGHRRVAPRLIGVARQGPALGPRRLDLVVQEHPGVVRQIVEQRLQPVVEQRQPVLHALPPRAFADGRVERIIARRPEQAQIAGAEPRNTLGVQQDLRHRGQGHRATLAGRALGRRIEGADRFQLRTEHVQPHRLLEARRIDVDDAAPHRELAAFRHRRGPHIAVGREIPLQGRRIEVQPDGGLEPGPVGHLTRRSPLDDRTHRGHHQGRSPVSGRTLRQDRQRRHPLGRHRRRWTQPVVGQAIPGRKFYDFNVFGKKTECLNELAHTGIVARNKDTDAALCLQPPGDRQGIQPLGCAPQFLIDAPGLTTVHQPAPSATAAATWSRMKSRILAITGVSCSSGVGVVPVIQP